MESGHIAGDWQNPTGDRSVVTGVKRVRIDAGKWSTPAHVENAEEEIFYVLSGSGVSWQDGACYDVSPGDCLVHTVRTEAHTLRANADGLRWSPSASGTSRVARGSRVQALRGAPSGRFAGQTVLSPSRGWQFRHARLLHRPDRGSRARREGCSIHPDQDADPTS